MVTLMKDIKKQSGIVIGTMVGVLALLGIIAASTMQFYSNISTVKLTNELSEKIKSQGSLISYRLMMCSMVYNDNASNLNQYPNGTDIGVASLVCPNSPYLNLWSEPDGVRLAPAPLGFSEWTYTKDTVGSTVYYSITANSDMAKKALNVASVSMDSQYTLTANTLKVVVY